MIENRVIIISGKKGEGKTTKLQNIVIALKNENIIINGFTSTASIVNRERNTYSLVDVNTNKSVVLSSSIHVSNYKPIGRFFFNPIAITLGEELLNSKGNTKSVSIIDEVGPFELQDYVWNDSLTNLLRNTNNLIIIVIREKLVYDVINKYKFNNYTIFNLDNDDNTIINEIKLGLI